MLFEEVERTRNMAGPCEAGRERRGLNCPLEGITRPILNTKHLIRGTVNCFHAHASHCGNTLPWPEVAHPDLGAELCAWDSPRLWCCIVRLGHLVVLGAAVLVEAGCLGVVHVPLMTP